MKEKHILRLSISVSSSVMLLLLGCFFTRPAIADENPAAPATEATQDDRDLKEIQQSILARYQRFSKTLTQLYGYMKETDPARAELLLRVIGKSNEARIEGQMEVLLDLLSNETPQLGGVVDRQEDLINSLINLLDVLQSENELQRLGDEIARIEDLIKNLSHLVSEQKEVRSGTERGQPTDRLEQGQEDVTDQAEKLADKIQEQDRLREEEANSDNEDKSDSEKDPNKDPSSPSESEPSESKPSESQPSESKPSESQPSESKPPESKPSESKPSESKPSESQPSESKPGEQEQQEGEQQESENQSSESEQQNKPEQTPGQEELESAIDKMQKAIEELKEKNRDDASAEQDRAIAELEKAKAKLEEILRQLREEEQKIMLAALEARFRKMLQMQVAVRKGSGPLSELTEDQKRPVHRARSVQLARDEQDILVEAEKALIVLREEGTSVAFPEAVLELQEDMRTIADRLNRFVVDDLTIAIEDDVIEALEEMVEALRKEMEKLEQQQQQDQQQQQGEQGDPGLVDLIAELKLLRSLQYRVNRRTKQYGRQIDGEQASDTELLRLLEELSIRQARIHRATYDLSIGKNQ